MKPSDSQRWKPAWHEQYWYLDFVGGIYTGTWGGEELDIQRYEAGNCFESYEQAEQVNEKINQILLNFHKQC